MPALTRLIRRCFRSEQGAVLPIVGLLFLTVVMVAGVAVDYGRAQLVRSKLHSALDAAGLSAASVAKSRDIKTEVLKFVEANFPQKYMDAAAGNNAAYPGSFVTSITVTNAQDGSVTLALTGRAEVNTLFMQVFGYDTIPVEVETVVSQMRMRGMELVLVLDNSGSMGYVSHGQTRLAALKQAANEMIRQLYGDRNSYDNLFVGISPFNHRVRVGAAKTAGSEWLRKDDSSAESIAGGIGCTDDRAEIRHPQYSTSNFPPVENAVPIALFNAEALAKLEADEACHNASMTPLRQNKQEIINAVNAMTSNGYTRIDLGTLWGWRMLSPSWKGLWSHAQSSLPLPYKTPNMDKVVIILTDGKNEAKDAAVVTAANKNLTTICNRMKAEGIIIYTVVAHLQDAYTQNLMRACATTEKHYFFVPPNGSITSVFQQITDSLMNLRISK